jgi:hypothetical protein
MTQLAFLYVFYKPDDDPIEPKHVAVLNKRDLLFLKKKIVLDCLFYCIITPLKYL